MEIRIPVLYLVAVLAAGNGAFTDLRDHKIYNRMTLPLIPAGFLMNMLLYGIGGLKNSLAGFLLGTSFILFWLAGMLKAGDIKLYMAIGALAGWRFCGYTLVSSVLTGGVASGCVMVVRKNGRTSFKRLGVYLTNLFYARQFHRYQPEEENAYFSFGCCIFVGTLITVFCCMGG